MGNVFLEHEINSKKLKRVTAMGEGTFHTSNGFNPDRFLKDKSGKAEHAKAWFRRPVWHMRDK